MAKPLKLTMACAPYDRVQPLFDGRVSIEGCELECHASLPDRTFAIASSTQQFDISEISGGAQLLEAAQGTTPYVAIPAFVSRCFRHSAIYIRTDRGITEPSDLRGKTVGVPQYEMTAALWVRGFLSDEYGVHARDIAWRTGKAELSGETPVTKTGENGFDIRPIGDGESLSTLLVQGRLDAVVASRPPSCFTSGDPMVRRLFPDYRTQEESYFRKTGLFPIMHFVGIRRSLTEEYPWLARSVYRAFCDALRTALEQLRYAGAYHASLPWLPDDLARVQDVMGDNFWRYGIRENEDALTAMLRWVVEQGMCSRKPRLSEIFAMDCLE